MTPELLHSFPSLGIFQCQFQAVQRIIMPEYAGSAWRGVLGHCLRKAVCVTRQTQCSGCLLINTCSYASLFEENRQSNSLRVRGGYPHPYVLGVPLHDARTLEPGDELSLDVTLMGNACSALPYLVHALQMAGTKGIGAGHGQFRLIGLRQRLGPNNSSWETLYTGDDALKPATDTPNAPFISAKPPAAASVEFITPLRIKRKGRLVGPREFNAVDDFILPLLWRISALSHIHGGADYSATDIDIKTHLDGLEFKDIDLHWHDWTRYSSRQNTRMQMGGMIGRLRIGGESLPALWPLLLLGQWIHTGKATTMGLGRYRLVEAGKLAGSAIDVD